MTITFENDSDVIVYALEKIVAFSRENQYLFVANCAWWIPGVIGLDEDLARYIDNLTLRGARTVREISMTPRDLTRNISVELEKQSLASSFNKYDCDPLRRTRKG